jgi:hypothetical protein
MSSRDGVPSLTLDELRRIAADKKEDLQRQANQGIRKKDWEQGIGALAAKEAIDDFIYQCEIVAGMYAEALRKVERRKPSNVTSLPSPAPIVRKRLKPSEKPDIDPATLPGWARGKKA